MFRAVAPVIPARVQSVPLAIHLRYRREAAAHQHRRGSLPRRGTSRCPRPTLLTTVTAIRRRLEGLFFPRVSLADFPHGPISCGGWVVSESLSPDAGPDRQGRLSSCRLGPARCRENRPRLEARSGKAARYTGWEIEPCHLHSTANGVIVLHHCSGTAALDRVPGCVPGHVPEDRQFAVNCNIRPWRPGNGILPTTHAPSRNQRTEAVGSRSG